MDERARLLEQLQRATEEVLGPRAPQLTETTELGDETVDSLDVVEIMMIVEEQEDFVADPHAFNDVTDVAGLIDTILSLRATHARG